MKASILLCMGLLVMLGWLQYKLWLSSDGVMPFWQLKRDIAQQDIQNKMLQKRNDQIAAEIEDLKVGTEAIEERARKDLGLMKSGEVFYQIVQ